MSTQVINLRPGERGAVLVLIGLCFLFGVINPLLKPVQAFWMHLVCQAADDVWFSCRDVIKAVNTSTILLYLQVNK